ncbi:MAG: flagellar biosynthetic protein FliO [Rhizomicrobium sp.]
MDLIDFARYVGALALVLGLVGFAALAAKRYGIPGIAKGIGNGRRLSIAESLMVGTKHKLVLFKRDGVEHLVLIGPASATVIEGGIAPAAIAQVLSMCSEPSESDAA